MKCVTQTPWQPDKAAEHGTESQHNAERAVATKEGYNSTEMKLRHTAAQR